ncbi:MAG: electron transfer flavoprotein subunit alpha [Gemmatimonadetes bacterium]|nr:electron transfer flavoprotein subunit alpha [Gemmatimonadota bacterium]
MSNLMVFVDHRDGSVSNVTREILSAASSLAKELGVALHALVLGDSGAGDCSGQLAEYGADKILVAEHPALSTYLSESHGEVVVSAVESGDYSAIIFPATAKGKDLAPRVAASLDTAMASDVSHLEIAEENLEATRALYGGKVLVRLRFTAFPAVITIRPNVFSAKKTSGIGQVTNIDVTLPMPEGYKVKEIETLGRKNLDVSEAHTVVSGGRGLKDPANWRLLEDLRDSLGLEAALGASRAVVDAGWRPHGEQVGQTGKTVAPRLYFAVGISGAVQHLAGMRTAQIIVAINKDADAPIFGVADYGVVGDAMEILPVLTEKIAELNSEE